MEGLQVRAWAVRDGEGDVDKKTHESSKKTKSHPGQEAASKRKKEKKKQRKMAIQS